jgi:glycosyltransferase involved in cell wall biosynthesis
VRVFGWLADHSGCGYYRIQQPLRQLQQQGLAEIECGQSLSLRVAEQYDVIVGQRIGHPKPTAMWQKLAYRKRHLLVYELDDDIWSLHPSNPAYHGYSSPDVRRMIEGNLRLADMVTTTTEQLAQVLRKFNPNVVVLPNCIDGDMLEIAPPNRPEDAPVHVGWAGTITHEIDFTSLGSSLRNYLASAPGVQFNSIGYEPFPGLPRGKTAHTRWVGDMWQYKRKLRAISDIGLAPLASIRFNRSKSPLRALELHALGVPGVYSGGYPYGLVVQDGETGLIAGGPSDWRRHVRTLVNDPEMRVEMGAAARELASGWTIETNAHRWARVYRGYLGGAAGATG